MPRKTFVPLIICLFPAFVAAEEVVFHGRPGSIAAFNAADTAIATDGAGRWVAAWSAPFEADAGAQFANVIFAATSFDQGHNWSRPVVVAADATAHAAQPALVFARSAWVVVWSQQAEDGGGADLVSSRSNDGGFTWTEPLVIAQADDGTHTNPALATAADGAVLAVWQSSATLGRTLGADFDVFFARSINGGKTWTEPEALHDNASADGGVDRRPVVAADNSGNCLAAWDSTEPLGEMGLDTDILYCVSADNGVTWSPVAPLNSNAPSDDGDTFVSIAAGGAGGWVAVWELTSAAAPGTRIAYAWSRDNGRSWSNAQRLVLARTAIPETAPRVVSDGQGRYLAAWTRDGEIAYAHSTDAGATWSRPKPLLIGEGVPLTGAHMAKAMKNPALVLGADAYGRWLVLWQDAGPEESGLKVSAGETIALLPLNSWASTTVVILLIGLAGAAVLARRKRYAD